MKERILVTGGAGYLGSVLVPKLLDNGHKVTVLDNFMYRQDSLAHVCYKPDLDIVRGDVRDETLISSLVSGVDVIIPLAALVGAPLCDRDPVGATSINLHAIEMMLKYTSKDQKILMPVSNSGYGIGTPGKFCVETDELKPVSHYGKTKVEAEAAILHQGNAVSFRLATVFGMSPRMRLDLLVNNFVHRAVHSREIVLFESHFKRNYIHVRDVAKVFIHGLECFEQMKGGAYNVGLSSANLSKMELCLKIKDYIPDLTIIEAPIGVDPDQRNYIVSNEKIEATGFWPEHSLDAGIRELIKGCAMLQNTRYGNV